MLLEDIPKDKIFMSCYNISIFKGSNDTFCDTPKLTLDKGEETSLGIIAQMINTV